MPTSTSAALMYTVGSWISARTATYSLPKDTPRPSQLCRRVRAAVLNLSGSLPPSQETWLSNACIRVLNRRYAGEGRRPWSLSVNFVCVYCIVWVDQDFVVFVWLLLLCHSVLTRCQVKPGTFVRMIATSPYICGVPGQATPPTLSPTRLCRRRSHHHRQRKRERQPSNRERESKRPHDDRQGPSSSASSP